LKRCASCHREGGAAMSLLTYEEARPWAKAIRDEVLNRRMPPWGAVKGYGEFRDDASLTQDEIMRIAEWVEGGAPAGDPAYLPTVPPARSTSAPPPGQSWRGTMLESATKVLGIRPSGDVAASKIYAVTPEGRVQPLIWLREYKQRWSRTFWYREPLQLPSGTRLVAEPHVPFQLILHGSRSRKRAR
ncbi:MAG TPA: cytochrome c, partial [Bryobacteraceae bacterium]|nr:cytochrome c [Bryobacteraceae bacterium]